MRYCVECEHFMRDMKAPERGPICMRFKREFIKSEHPVHGAEWAYSAPDCEVARAVGGQCGPEARFYIARPGTKAYADALKAERAERLANEKVAQPTRPWWRFW